MFASGGRPRRPLALNETDRTRKHAGSLFVLACAACFVQRAPLRGALANVAPCSSGLRVFVVAVDFACSANSAFAFVADPGV